MIKSKCKKGSLIPSKNPFCLVVWEGVATLVAAVFQKQQGVEGLPQAALFAIGFLAVVALIVLASQQRRLPGARP